jgi:NAD(P)-dependent dehydrogenase (short-subunit alcohol dehydrogenase family)
MRLKDKIAIIVGAGQSPGEGVGNGRATALLFARGGAKVLCADKSLASAEETATLVENEAGVAVAVAADVTKDASLHTMIDYAIKCWGRIDNGVAGRASTG